MTFNVTDGYQTINPITATVTITGHNNSATFDGEEHSVSGYDTEISNSLYTEADFGFTGTAAAALTDVGTQTMGLAAEQFTNKFATPVTLDEATLDRAPARRWGAVPGRS